MFAGHRVFTPALARQHKAVVAHDKQLLLAPAVGDIHQRRIRREIGLAMQKADRRLQDSPAPPRHGKDAAQVSRRSRLPAAGPCIGAERVAQDRHMDLNPADLVNPREEGLIRLQNPAEYAIIRQSFSAPPELKCAHVAQW